MLVTTDKRRESRRPRAGSWGTAGAVLARLYPRTDMLFYPLVFVSAVSTLLSYVFVYAQNVVKAVVSLVHAALALELSRAVRGARSRLAGLVRQLASSGEILAPLYYHTR